MPPATRVRIARRLGAGSFAASALSLLVSGKAFAIAITIGTAWIVAAELSEDTPATQAAPPTARTGVVRAPIATGNRTPSTASAPPAHSAYPMTLATASAAPNAIPAPRARVNSNSEAASRSSEPHAEPVATSISAQPSAAPLPRDSLTDELARIDRARALVATNPAVALAMMDDLAGAYPRGKLVLERELLALDALDKLGRHAEARARAARLLPMVRGSIYEERIERRAK
jgi:hypothetical protein